GSLPDARLQGEERPPCGVPRRGPGLGAAAEGELQRPARFGRPRGELGLPRGPAALLLRHAAQVGRGRQNRTLPVPARQDLLRARYHSRMKAGFLRAAAAWAAAMV